MDYYLLIGGLKKGPFGFEELLQNGLTADVLVSRRYDRLAKSVRDGGVG